MSSSSSEMGRRALRISASPSRIAALRPSSRSWRKEYCFQLTDPQATDTINYDVCPWSIALPRIFKCLLPVHHLSDEPQRPQYYHALTWSTYKPKRSSMLNRLAEIHIVELPFCEPGNVWSSKVFWLNHIDYVSLNSTHGHSRTLL